MDKLVDRLRGIYSVGPNTEFGIRSFADFVPPVALEAANRIEELESALAETAEQVYDNPAIDELVERVLNNT